MGLGSQNKIVRKEFRSIAGKSDWKNTINTVDDAKSLIQKLNDNLRDDPNSKLLLATYAGGKIKALEQYITHSDGKMTLKEYERTC